MWPKNKEIPHWQDEQMIRVLKNRKRIDSLNAISRKHQRNK